MVKLAEFDDARFRAYRDHLIRRYAQGKAEAGVWAPKEAVRKARGEMDRLLTDGPATKGHFLYEIRDDSIPTTVGAVWYAVRETGVGLSVWIYDIVVYDDFQRQGYGAMALEAVERKAGELAASRVELHVFGHNHGARALYDRAGYSPTSIVMAKRLEVSKE